MCVFISASLLLTTLVWCVLCPLEEHLFFYKSSFWLPVLTLLVLTANFLWCLQVPPVLVFLSCTAVLRLSFWCHACFSRSPQQLTVMHLNCCPHRLVQVASVHFFQCHALIAWNPLVFTTQALPVLWSAAAPSDTHTEHPTTLGPVGETSLTHCLFFARSAI